MITRSVVDFSRALQVQYDAIRLSAASFDVGFIGEAVRIANAVYVAVGPKARSHTSLIDHLGANETKFPTTVAMGGVSGSPLIHANLQVVENIDGKSAVWNIALHPRGREGLMTGRVLPLNEWWSEIVVRAENCELSRLNLIRAMRDKDGGAHFDANLTDKNYIIASTEPVAFSIKLEGGQTQKISGFLEASVRQIANEVLLGLGPEIYKAEKVLHSQKQE